MKRKKFIKLAMSKGYDKRMATDLANMVLQIRKSYYVGYVITLKQLGVMELHDEFYND